MKLSLLTAIVTSVLVFGRSLQSALDNSIVLEDVTVIDCTGRSPQRHITVVIANGRIAAIGKAGRVKIPEGAELVEASGKFLIPGLWNMHVHSVSYESAKRSIPALLARKKSQPCLLLGEQFQDLQIEISATSKPYFDSETALSQNRTVRSRTGLLSFL